MTRVLICHRWAVVRDGMRTQLERAEGIQVAATTGSGISAMADVLSGRVDLIVTSLDLDGLDGLELLRRVRTSGVEVRVIVVMMSADLFGIDDILVAAPDGVVQQECTPEEFYYTVRSVSAGETVVSGSVAERLVEWFRASTTDRAAAARAPDAVSVSGLTAREVEILGLVARCRSTTDVAKDLGIGVSTVRTHLYRLRTKIGVRDQAGLVSYAFRSRIIESP